MLQGQLKRFVSRKRRVLQRHCRNSFSRTHHKSSIATWNLRRLGQGNWGETSWLKLRMLTRMCAARGCRAILLSDCFCDGSGSFSFRGLGGSWLVVFNGRCGILLVPAMANMWRRGGERRHDSPDGRSLAVVVPCAGRGFRGRVLSLVSVYGPVSGAGFDDERRVMFDSLSAILGFLPEGSVWIISGDFNAEIGFCGVGEESTLGTHALLLGDRFFKGPWLLAVWLSMPFCSDMLLPCMYSLLLLCFFTVVVFLLFARSGGFLNTFW